MELKFGIMCRAALNGITSAPCHYDRGHNLQKLKDEYDTYQGFDTFIDRTTLPYSLNVSWSKNLNVMRERFRAALPEKGPYDVLDICKKIVVKHGVRLELDQLSSTERKMTELYACGLTYDYCKIKIKCPFGNIYKKIRELDDSQSYFYFGHDSVIPSWTENGKTGTYFYISDRKIAMMVRIAFGFDYTDLTEPREAV